MARTVLIVDDDPTQRRLLQAVLEKQGYSAECAESGEQALQRVGRGGVPGLGVLRRVHEGRRRRGRVGVTGGARQYSHAPSALTAVN